MDYNTRVKRRRYMEEFVVQLKSKGYMVAALSNTCKPHVTLNKKVNLYQNFDKVFLSNEIGLIKPEKECFQYVLDRLGLKPQECVFVDDDLIYVEAAKKIGIKAILFTNLKELKENLKKLGIRF